MKIRRIHDIKILAVFISGTLLFSCQDVINVNLKNTDPRLVIEGNVSNLSDSVIVLVHWSTDYYTPSAITPVNDAMVTLSDSAGSVHQLLRISDGIYVSTGIQAKPGDAFDLEVSEAGIIYSSLAQMPVLVNIDSITFDKDPDRPGEDRLNIHIKDPAGIPNYYQVEIFLNDSLLNSGNRFFLYSDKFFDGKVNVLSIDARRLGISVFKKGARIRVMLINIEKVMYDYLDVLRSITNEGEILSVSTPANPPNNITNGALGYFAVNSISEKIVVKQ